MKKTIKPGDVVDFTSEARDHTWAKWFMRLNGGFTFIVHSEALPGSDGFHLLRMNGKRVRWNTKHYRGSRERGVWEGWLVRNEFLTSAHKANNRKEKHDS